MDDFYAYQRSQNEHWASSRVHVEDFHYATAQKDIVCRCTRPNNHGQGWVRNTEIIEMCAEFFYRNKAKMTCTKAQWRTAGTVSPGNNASQRFIAPNKDAANIIPVEGDIISKSIPSKYDSKSTTDLLRARADASVDTPYPSPKSDMEHLRSGPTGAADIPEEVWTKARPSVWTDRRVSASSSSTPLGIASVPHFPTGQVSHAFISEHEVATQHASAATNWSQVQRDAEGELYKIPTASSACSLTPTRTKILADKFGASILQKPSGAEPSYYTRPRRSSSLYSDDPEVSPGMISLYTSEASDEEQQFLPKVYELPSQHVPAELFTIRNRHELVGGAVAGIDYQAVYLRELEGNRPGSYSGWPGRQACISIVPSSLSQKSMEPSPRLSTIFQEIEAVVGLPDQEEFLLRHVAVCSRANPPPLRNCSLCKQPHRDRGRRAIGLPGCGHFLHEGCLIADFRIRDESIGRCPLCRLALCMRDLADCLETDRKAIFGSQHTRRHDEVRIEFQIRGQIARLQSEEEFAAAQLRLLKDYIEVHADECWQQWQAHTSTEPDWFGEVIKPSIKLFKGWNLPSQQSRYFCDRDAFLKFVAWAELVRLMNVTKVAASKVQGPRTPFPSLAELHRKFFWSKDRYEKEKNIWKTTRSGVLDCEKVAQDAYNLAMSTLSCLN
ncbi:hypothetical protein HBH46_000260 [Parastagonospora nodorum]|nr:hypothetical protein HBH46_000260 [Parastagonospora nodorum]